MKNEFVRFNPEVDMDVPCVPYVPRKTKMDPSLNGASGEGRHGDEGRPRVLTLDWPLTNQGKQTETAVRGCKFV